MKKLTVEPLDLVITGVGGQGNVLASQVLGSALLKAGYAVTVGETYGLSQRGGTVMSQVRVTHKKVMGPLIPENRATAVISLEPLEALRTLPVYGHPDVIVLTNDRPLYPLSVISGESEYPDLNELRSTLAGLAGKLFWLPATAGAVRIGSPILTNVVMLGALAAVDLLPIDVSEIEAALASIFGDEKMAGNRQALKIGQELMRGKHGMKF